GLERRALVAACLLLAAAAPMGLRRLPALFVLQHAAHPDHGGDLIFRQTDALAPEIGRRADAGIGAHIDAGMPEQSRHEGRDAHIGRIPRCDRAHIARKRKLRHVEFLVTEGAKEDFFGIKRQGGDLAAFDLAAAAPVGRRGVVIAARNRYRHLNHWGLLIVSRWDGMGARQRNANSSLRQSVLASFSAVKRRLVVYCFARYFWASVPIP